MCLKAKIEGLNKSANTIRELTRGLNIRATELIGVIATIPQSAPIPASYFKGCKVILHNVTYDHDAGHICATITFPYSEDINNPVSGCTQRFSINESWFE